MRPRGVLLLAVLPVLRVAAMADEHVRLIRKIVRPELEVPSVVPAVRRALATPSTCVPEGGVVLSVTNKHHARLRPLQFERIRHRSCFMDRVVSVCYNNVSDAFGSCVRSAFVIPPSDFRRSNYANLIWAKWRIISDSLKAATMAMWLDADVLILRNPWASLNLLGPPESTPQYDIRYQSDPPPTANAEACVRPLPMCPTCSSVNGGQLLVRSKALARAIYQARPRNLSNADQLDQDWVSAILFNDSYAVSLVSKHRKQQLGSFSSCVLPNSFAAECWYSPSFRIRATSAGLVDSNSCDKATHHFNCVTHARGKAAQMKDMLEKWTSACGNSTAAE